ncbi:MAG: alpha/beta hydrolase [Oscillibacter sp.]|nr:alpha/beta hydrolase [Oscillibacter sp.]
MKRKWLALLLCLAALLLSACGGNGGGTQEETAQETGEEQQAEPPEEAGQPEDAQQPEEEPQVEQEAWRMEELPLKIGDDDIYGVMYLPIEEKEAYPTVILSHGFGGSTANCEPYAKIFAANGYACYVLEFRGGGPNSRSSRTMTEMSVLTEAEDLSAVLEQVKALDYVDERQVFLWGESQGGFVSSYVAAQHPDEVKALVLFYPAFVLQDDARERYPDPADIPETETLMGNTLGAIYARDAMSFDIYDVIGDYKGDVLILHGDEDPIVPLSYAERADEVYESSELIVIPGAGHGFWDQVEETAAYVTDFLQAHTE